MRAVEYPPDRYAVAPLAADALIMLAPFWSPSEMDANDNAQAEVECRQRMAAEEFALAFVMSLRQGYDPLTGSSPHPHELRYLDLAANARHDLGVFEIRGAEKAQHIGEGAADGLVHGSEDVGIGLWDCVGNGESDLHCVHGWLLSVAS